MGRIFNLAVVLLVLFSFMVIPVKGLAEVDPEQDAVIEKSNTQEENGETFTLGTIVVTDTRIDAEDKKQEVFDSPDPVSIITSEQIDRLKPKSLGDLFIYEPGVDMTDDATYWARKPIIRGLKSDRVIIIVDGIRLKTHLGMGGAYLSLIDPDMVEEVEIIKGPKSVLYGSDAIGGVIKITTKKPKKALNDFYLRGKLDVGYCTVNNMRSGRVELAGSKDNLSVYGGLSYRQTDDYDLPSGGKEKSEFQEDNVDLNVTYSFLENHSLGCSYVRHRVWDVGSPPFVFDIDRDFLTQMADMDIMDTMADIIEKIENMVPGSDSPFISAGFHIGFDEMIYEKYSLNYTGSDITSHWDEVIFNCYYQDTPMDFFVEITPRVFGVDMVSIDITTEFTVKTEGGSVENSLHYGNHSLKFGVDAYRDRADGDDFNVDISLLFIQFMPFSITMQLPPLKADLESIDFFLQDEWESFDFLTLIFGGRYDCTRSENHAEEGNALQDLINNLFGIDDLSVDHDDEAFTYSIQSIFHLTDHMNFLAGVATGFRVPNLMERYLMGSVGLATSIANPYLEPEKSLNTEVGLKGYNPGEWDWQITGYRTELDDMIVAKLLIANAMQFVNAKEGEIWGIEAEGSYYFDPNWSITANITYCRGENKTTDTHLNSIPPLNGNIALRYQKDKLYSVDDFWVQFETRLVDRHDRIEKNNNMMVDSMYQMAPGFGDVETPGFALFNMRAGFSFPQGVCKIKTDLNLAIENILDKEYTEPLSFQRIQPGRNYKVFLTMNF